MPVQLCSAWHFVRYSNHYVAQEAGDTSEALRELKVKSAYLDGELCALNSEGVPAFNRLQAAMDEGRTDQLVSFAFDLLFLNGESTAQLH